MSDEYAKSPESIRIEGQRMAHFNSLSEEAKALIVANGTLLMLARGPIVLAVQSHNDAVNEECSKYFDTCNAICQEHME